MQRKNKRKFKDDFAQISDILRDCLLCYRYTEIITLLMKFPARENKNLEALQALS